MSDFLGGEKLSAAICNVMSGANLCCGVAFWGTGATQLMKACGQSSFQDVKIICDLSMGGTSPKELRLMGAPDNGNLRHHKGLHAKVYISSVGAVVTSANMSSNGIGFKEKVSAKLTEAGTFYGRHEPAWLEASEWFNKIYDPAKVVDAGGLALSEQRWRPTGANRMFDIPVRPTSLLDLVRSVPEAFGNVGFVFASDKNDEKVVAKAIKNAVKLGVDAEDLNSSPTFSDWESEDLDKWPNFFFEFWMPGDKLLISGLKKTHSDWDTGTVFAKKSWRLLKRKINADLPTAAQANISDRDLAKKIRDPDKSGIMFPTAIDLCKILNDMELDA